MQIEQLPIKNKRGRPKKYSPEELRFRHYSKNGLFEKRKPAISDYMKNVFEVLASGTVPGYRSTLLIKIRRIDRQARFVWWQQVEKDYLAIAKRRAAICILEKKLLKKRERLIFNAYLERWYKNMPKRKTRKQKRAEWRMWRKKLHRPRVLKRRRIWNEIKRDCRIQRRLIVQRIRREIRKRRWIKNARKMKHKSRDNNISSEWTMINGTTVLEYTPKQQETSLRDLLTFAPVNVETLSLVKRMFQYGAVRFQKAIEYHPPKFQVFAIFQGKTHTVDVIGDNTMEQFLHDMTQKIKIKPQHYYATIKSHPVSFRDRKFLAKKCNDVLESECSVHIILRVRGGADTKEEYSDEFGKQCRQCKKVISPDQESQHGFHKQCLGALKDDIEEQMKNACINVDDNKYKSIYEMIVKFVTSKDITDISKAIGDKIKEAVQKYGKNNSKEIEKQLDEEEKKKDEKDQRREELQYVWSLTQREPSNGTPEELYDKLLDRYDKSSKLGLTAFEYYNETKKYVKPHIDFDYLMDPNKYSPGAENAIKDKVMGVLKKIFDDNDWAIAMDIRFVNKPPNDGSYNKETKQPATSMKISFHFVLHKKCTEMRYLRQFMKKNLKVFEQNDVPLPDMAVYRIGINKFRPPYTKKSQENSDNSIMSPVNYDTRQDFHKHLVSYTKGCKFTNLGITNLTETYASDEEKHITRHNHARDREIDQILAKYNIKNTYEKDFGTCYILTKDEFYCGETHKNNHNYIVKTKYGYVKLKCHSQRCKDFCKTLYSPTNITVHFDVKYLTNTPITDGQNSNYNECKKYFERYFIHILDNNKYYRKDFKRIEGSRSHTLDLVEVTMGGYEKKMYYTRSVADLINEYNSSSDDKFREKYPTVDDYIISKNKKATFRRNENDQIIGVYENFFKRYLRDMKTRSYNAFKFEPLPFTVDLTKVRHRDCKFNKFNGYGYNRCISQHQKLNIPEISRFRFKALMRYIRYNICGLESAINSNNHDGMVMANKLYMYLMRMVRNTMEAPTKPPHVIMTFFSEPGTGKSGFLKFLQNVVGLDLSEVYEIDTLGNPHFNKHVGKLMNIIEEADPRKSKKYADKLNSFSQRTLGTYNEKHQKEVTVDDYTRFWMTTNYGVYIQDGDRRYVIYKPDKVVGRSDYFRLIQQAEEDKYVVYLFGKFIESMIDTKYHSVVDWEKARPLSETYNAMRTGDPIAGFLMEIYDKSDKLIINEMHTTHSNGVLYISKADLYKVYQDYCKNYAGNRCKSNEMFKKEISIFYHQSIDSVRTRKILDYKRSYAIKLKKLWYRLGITEKYENRYKSDDNPESANSGVDENTDYDQSEIKHKFVAISKQFNQQLDTFLNDYGGAPKRTDYINKVPEKELVILHKESDDYEYGEVQKQKVDQVEHKEIEELGMMVPVKVNKVSSVEDTEQSNAYSAPKQSNPNSTWNTHHRSLPPKLSPPKSDVSGPLEFQIIDVLEKDIYCFSTKKKWYNIFIFARLADGRSIAIRVEDQKPVLQIVLGTVESVDREIEKIKNIINEKAFKQPTLEISHSKKRPYRRYVREDKTIVEIKFESLIEFNVSKAALTKKKYETCNAYGEQYIKRFIENKIDTMGWCTVTDYVNSENRETKCAVEISAALGDITKIDRIEHANFRIASYDIEARSATGAFPNPENVDDQVVQISLTWYNYKTPDDINKMCFNLGKCDKVEGSEIIECDTEEDILIKFAQEVETLDVDVLSGHNINGFDYDFIAKRAFNLGIFGHMTMFSRLIEPLIYKDFKKITECNSLKQAIQKCKWQIKAVYDDNTVNSSRSRFEYKPSIVIKAMRAQGRVNIDTLHYFRDTDGMDKLPNYKLETVAQHYLKIDKAKDDISFKEMFRIFESETSGTPQEKAKVAKYCIKDSALCCQIISKTHALENIIEISKLSNITAREYLSNGSSYKATMMLLEECMNTNMVILDKALKKESYQGAEVIDPKVGFWNAPVSVNDFKSLYPNATVAMNICPSTLLKPEEVEQMDKNDYNAVHFEKPKMKFIRAPKSKLAKFKATKDDTDTLDMYELETAGYKKTTTKYKKSVLTEFANMLITEDSIKQLRPSEFTIVSSIEPETYYFRKEPKGLLPKACETLLRERAKTKKKMKQVKGIERDLLDTKQMSQKISVNSLYGVQGSSGKLSDTMIAEAITATGRNLLHYTIKFTEQGFDGSINIGGDTDSGFTKFQLKEHKCDCQNHATHMNDRVNKIMQTDYEPLALPESHPELKIYEECKCPDIGDTNSQKALDESIRLAKTLEKVVTYLLPNSAYKGGMNMFEYEKTYMPFLIFKKKNYVGMKYEHSIEDGKQAQTGIILNRRDKCNALKTVYQKCLDVIMNRQPERALEILEHQLSIELPKMDPQEFAMSTEYKKTASEYKTKNALAEMVKAMEDRETTQKIYIGDRVDNCITRSKNSSKGLVGRLETPTTVREHNLTLDYAYYITNKFTTPLAELFKVLGAEDKAVQILKMCATKLNSEPIKDAIPFKRREVKPQPKQAEPEEKKDDSPVQKPKNEPKQKPKSKPKPKAVNMKGVVNKNRYALIDEANVIFRIFTSNVLAHRMCVKDMKKSQKDCVDDPTFMPYLRKRAKQAIEEIQYTQGVPWENMIFCREVKRSTLWRRDIYPQYKANRDESQADSELDLGPIFKTVSEEFAIMQKERKFKGFRHERCEGDDVVYMIREHIKSNNKDATFIIVSNDSDFRQLVRDDTKQVSPLKKKAKKEKPLDALTPQQFLIAKILMGDKSDNIPQAVKRCGEKTAIKIITKGLLDDKLKDDATRTQYELNKRLIDLSMIPTKIQQAFYERMKKEFAMFNNSPVVTTDDDNDKDGDGNRPNDDNSDDKKDPEPEQKDDKDDKPKPKPKPAKKQTKTKTKKAKQASAPTPAKEKFNVALARKYEKKVVDKYKGDWYMSRKYDGIRCIVMIDKLKKEVNAYTRTGKPITTLSKLTEDLKSDIDQFDNSYVLDGELVSVDENGDEDYTSIMKQYNRKNHTIDNPMLLTFDMIQLDEFRSGKSKDVLTDRQSNLQQMIGTKFKHIRVMDQIKMDNDEVFEKFRNKGRENGWEGIMLRQDAPYKSKRSNAILKVKDVQDAEYKVLDMKPKVLSDGTVTNTMGSVKIDYGDTWVGSGFTDKQRAYYFNNRDEIIGKIITVKYFEKTETSLRFPTFKCIHGTKRTT